MIKYDDYLEKQLKSSAFKKEWDKSEPAYQITRELIRNRINEKLTQGDLAKRVGTTQAVISRIENMTVNPSVELLARIAEGLNKRLRVRFV